MKNKVIILSLCLATSLAGILFWRHRTMQTDSLLLQADTLMDTRPDSALKLLQGIRSPQKYRGANRALYALLMTQAMYKNYLPVENDSLVRIAADYYATRSDSLRKAWSYFYAAQVYRDMKDRKRAIDYFQKAATAAEGCSDNYKLQDLLYYYWGKLIQKEKPYEEGLDKLLQSKRYGELNKDTLSVIQTLKDIAWSYVWKEDYPPAQDNLQQAVRMAQLIQDKDMLAWLYYHLSILYLLEENYPEALTCVNLSIRFGTYDDEKIEQVYFHKGSVFNRMHQYDSARFYLGNQATSTDFYFIADYHKEMSGLEKGMDNYKKALEHQEVYAKYLDSIKTQQDDERVMDLQKRYDYSLIQNENFLLKERNQRNKILLLSITVLLLMALFVTYYAHNKTKKEKELIIRTKDAMLAQSIRQLQQKADELLQYRQAIQDKEGELREYILKEKGLKESITQKEEELQTYIRQQKELKIRMLQMTQVAEKLGKMNALQPHQKIKDPGKLALSQQEIGNLFCAINLCHDNFEERLRANYPKLTNEDIYICCLIKMGVSNQDIIILLTSSEEAMKKRRYRIKRDKLNITQEDVSLADFLKNY